MDQLTSLERDLLAQFKKLAEISGNALEACQQMQAASQQSSSRLHDRLDQIESRQKRLIEHLNEQTATTQTLTEGLAKLIAQVNTLLEKQRS